MTPVSSASRASFPALLLTQNKHRFFFTTIPVDNIFPSCFVSRRDNDAEAGFQRALNESRAEDIAEYLAGGDGSIPSNVVLSAQDSASVKYDSRKKLLSFTPHPNAFLVLDGQHRLWGYQKCAKRHRVPVAIYESLSRSDEAKLFIDINTTQRGVPAALLLDIKHIANIESDKETTLRRLFDGLRADSDSPLAGRLSPAKSVHGKISRVTFNKAVGGVLSSGVMLDTDASHRPRLLKNYLNAFDAELEDKKLLTTAAFFEAVFEVFNTVVQSALTVDKTAKQNALQRVVQPLSRLNFRSTSGSVMNKRDIVELMQSTLRSRTAITGEML